MQTFQWIDTTVVHTCMLSLATIPLLPLLTNLQLYRLYIAFGLCFEPPTLALLSRLGFFPLLTCPRWFNWIIGPKVSVPWIHTHTHIYNWKKIQLFLISFSDNAPTFHVLSTLISHDLISREFFFSHIGNSISFFFTLFK